MQRAIIASASLLVLNACVTPLPQLDYSTRAEGGNIGIINFLPRDLIHNHYGVLAGVSQRHAHHPAPFDVGGEFAQALSSKINEHTIFTARVVAAPPALEKIRFDAKRIADYDYRRNPPWWVDGKGVVYPDFVEVFKELAEQQNLDSFIVLSPYWQRPSLQNSLPPSFSFAVQTKDHSPWYFSHTMISAVCLAFDMEHLRVRDLCEFSPNSIALEYYTAPEDPGAPLPRMQEIGKNLLAILRGKVIEVVEIINGSEPGSLSDMAFESRPTVDRQASAGIADQVSPLDYFGQAEEEMSNNAYDKNLWAKALVEADGDETKRKARYIVLRANQLYAEKTGSTSNLSIANKPEYTTGIAEDNYTGIYRMKVTGKLGWMVQKKAAKLQLFQVGKTVTGNFGAGGKIWGEVDENEITFDWYLRGTSGTGKWKFDQGGQLVNGRWGASWLGEGDWNLSKEK